VLTPPQQSPHPGLQFSRAERLGHEIVRTTPQALQLGPMLGQGIEHDNWHKRPLPDLAEHFSIPARLQCVEDDQIWLDETELKHDIHPAGGREDLEFISGEGAAQEILAAGIISDNQDFPLHNNLRPRCMIV